MSTGQGSNVLFLVASLAIHPGGKYVDPYSHQNSPQRLTQRSLLTCLILTADLETTYRGVIEALEVSDTVRNKGNKGGDKGDTHFRCILMQTKRTPTFVAYWPESAGGCA